jgi:hypothetical protein
MIVLGAGMRHLGTHSLSPGRSKKPGWGSHFPSAALLFLVLAFCALLTVAASLGPTDSSSSPSISPSTSAFFSSSSRAHWLSSVQSAVFQLRSVLWQGDVATSEEAIQAEQDQHRRAKSSEFGFDHNAKKRGLNAAEVEQYYIQANITLAPVEPKQDGSLTISLRRSL